MQSADSSTELQQRGGTYRHGHAARHHGWVHAHGAWALGGAWHPVGGWGPVEATLRGEACSLGEHASHGGLRGAPGGLHGLQLGHALGILLLELLLPYLQQTWDMRSMSLQASDCCRYALCTTSVEQGAYAGRYRCRRELQGFSKGMQRHVRSARASLDQKYRSEVVQQTPFCQQGTALRRRKEGRPHLSLLSQGHKDGLALDHLGVGLCDGAGGLLVAGEAHEAKALGFALGVTHDLQLTGSR